MSGYEKVSFLKLEAAGQSWHIVSHGLVRRELRVEVEEVQKNSQEDSHKYGVVDVDSGCWIEVSDSLDIEEQAAIVDYLRANPLPGEIE